ncbi:hypothetical protein [Alkalicoccobacillus gibsonii]|uniref:hypothetical protein n=2 Tax=Alkalicoccobacillus gibsonii TaxID=79881 RepID=UPI0019347FA9|nr:hypothetical protein [Alkalicoccobacillus gibsonii]MBM0064553.1 hypothetical protein [Alkalicoccobacillus gibsonii]
MKEQKCAVFMNNGMSYVVSGTRDEFSKKIAKKAMSQNDELYHGEYFTFKMSQVASIEDINE